MTRYKWTLTRVHIRTQVAEILPTSVTEAFIVPEKTEWATTKDALIEGFDAPADRQEALRSFRMAQLGIGVGSLWHAIDLRTLLDRALPTLNEAAHSELLLERFVERPEISKRATWHTHMESWKSVWRQLYLNVAGVLKER
ncbi:unnamed protein product [Echinostoma caproni]|uniref:Transposase n=1 Tax=Echinostoma caproni TaxID=27848 RepID=A0A183BES2_9TREM|nr:unnamed protein product [Echinostoma caproni]